jgi:phage baseplate assembly protein gpV
VTATLYETIARIVADELRALRTSALAVVQEAHPHAEASDSDNYAVTVALRDTGLVLRRVPIATGRIGSVAVPEPGELVLVAFIGGDVNLPVIVGRLYDDQGRPPPSDVGRHVTHLPLGAGDDEAVHIELRAAGERVLELKLGSTVVVTLADDDPAVTLDVGGGAATVRIARDGAVSVESAAKLTLKGAEVAVEASGALTLKGATVDIN